MSIMILLILMISCTVGANLLMKLGSDLPVGQQAIFGLFSVTTLIGMGLFGVALIFYARVLRVLPLNVAQSFAALQFVAVILASAAVLGEPIPAIRWFGIAFIAGGIVLVSRSNSLG